jgi:hypothetical protein
MNSLPDTALSRADQQIGPIRQERETALNAPLVELGKVSATLGSWIGDKSDTGVGHISY